MTQQESRVTSELIDNCFQGLLAERRAELVLRSPYTTIEERQAAWSDMRNARFHFGMQLVFGFAELADSLL